MPAFLSPGEGPPPIPEKIHSVAFLFAVSPYKTLGQLKPNLSPEELQIVYFTEGLASIVLLNLSIERIHQLRKSIDECAFEFWPIKDSILDNRLITAEIPSPDCSCKPSEVLLPVCDDPEIKVYTEQISASLASLWSAYGIYFPEERKTLILLSKLAKRLVEQYCNQQSPTDTKEPDLVLQKKSNALISALVELSAALSYAVTQGTSGSLPILSNRSPFPHHSLIGVGGAIRALTKYTRYLESAFMIRSAQKVICSQYSVLKGNLPASVPKYNSGPEYKFSASAGTSGEHFDSGGDFHQDDHVPLITHFSLRHGFMESKFSVTAASEALTAETLPQWTLMTLSHEVMHSRVRTIFQALLGRTWDEGEYSLISKEQYEDFSAWIRTRNSPNDTTVCSGLRNVILNFCYAVEKAQNPIAAKQDNPGYLVPVEKLSECYSRHKQLAIEIVVQFHDYYFVYACQPKMYIMSLWASWIKVAAPYARPHEYLIRSLVTIACGTGLESPAAFDFAKEMLLEGLDALEAGGVRSSLFKELRRLISEEEDRTRAHFYPGYYLIDIVRLFFASRTISSKIDRIESDPFAEGSTDVDDYSANIFVYGEEQSASPIRYSLSTLCKTLTNHNQIDDPQWLTAWNYMVISS